MRVRIRRTPQTRSHICPTSWDADMASFISKRLPATSLSARIAALTYSFCCFNLSVLLFYPARISASDNLHYNYGQTVISPLPPPPFKHTAIFRRPTHARTTAVIQTVRRPPHECMAAVGKPAGAAERAEFGPRGRRFYRLRSRRPGMTVRPSAPLMTMFPSLSTTY